MHISPEVLKMLGYDRVKHFDRKACQAVVEITFIICLMHEKVALDLTASIALQHGKVDYNVFPGPS